MRREELYRQAVRHVAIRRQKAESEAIRLRQEAYAKEPALARLDEQKSEAGIAAARHSAAGQKSEAVQQLALVQQLAAQQAALLENMGYGKAGLAPRYHCAVCKDTGRHNGAVCNCVQEEMKRLRQTEINGGGALRLCRFESFSLEFYPERMELDGSTVYPRKTMEALLAECRGWAADFGPHSQSLYMFGDAGLGKTHLALSIAAEVLQAGHDVIYVSAQSAFSTLANDREAGTELFDTMLKAELLVLDDLGTEYVTPYVRAKLYELVDGRMRRRPTIYTSNICKREILDGRYDEKITSRLLGECHPMRFWGEDIRLKKK